MAESKKEKMSKRTRKTEKITKIKHGDIYCSAEISQKAKLAQYADNLIELNKLQLAVLTQLKILLKKL